MCTGSIYLFSQKACNVTHSVYNTGNVNTKVLSLLLFFISFTAVSQVRAAVLINEVVPKTDPSINEWVELYNTDSSSVSLNQWKLTHTADGASFILPASAIIEPHGFLLFTGSQTAISFNIYGDTVRLFDQNGILTDSVNYPGTLGFSTSMGRTTDGGAGWVVCAPDPYKATPNGPNNCPPAPTPTTTPTPTPQPNLPAGKAGADQPLAGTPPPAGGPTPTSAGQSPLGGASPQTFGSLIPTPTGTQVLGAAKGSTPTPAGQSPLGGASSADVLQFKISKMWIVYALMMMAAAALALMLAMWVKQRQVRKK